MELRENRVIDVQENIASESFPVFFIECHNQIIHELPVHGFHCDASNTTFEREMEKLWDVDGRILRDKDQGISLVLEQFARPRYSNELALAVRVSFLLAQLSLGECRGGQSVMSIGWDLPFVEIPVRFRYMRDFGHGEKKKR